MEIKDFKDYQVANISDEEVETLTKLEKQLSDKSDHDIVLIAYQANHKVKA